MILLGRFRRRRRRAGGTFEISGPGGATTGRIPYDADLTARRWRRRFRRIGATIR